MSTHWIKSEAWLRPACGTPHDVDVTTDRDKTTCRLCRGTFAFRHPRPEPPGPAPLARAAITPGGPMTTPTETGPAYDPLRDLSLLIAGALMRSGDGLGVADGQALRRLAAGLGLRFPPGVSNAAEAEEAIRAALTAEPARTWRRCRHCHADITERGAEWEARLDLIGGRAPNYCPENGGGHEPSDGDGQRSFQLAREPVRYGHGNQLMREVIETDPKGRRSVFAAVPDSHAFDIWELLGRVYGLGREDLAAERAGEDQAAAERYDAALDRAMTTAAELYAADEPGGCEDYARGQAALIAAAFGIPGKQDQIEAAITGDPFRSGAGWNPRGAVLRIGLAAADHLRGETELGPE